MLLRHKSPSSPPGMTVGDYRSSALYMWSSTAPGGGFFFLLKERAGGREGHVSDEDGDNTCSKKVHVGGRCVLCVQVGTVDTLCIFVPVSADDY